MEHIKYTSIEQFRNIINEVKHIAQYVGMDDYGDVVMNRNAKLPTLTFIGTVKCHGTNFSVCSDDTGEMWFQSRENIITPEKDNAGSAQFGIYNKDRFQQIFNKVYGSSDYDSITIYGEWCGKGIQKGVAIAELPKMFIIFDIAIVINGQKQYLTESQIKSVLDGIVDIPNGTIPEHNGIYSIYSFPTYVQSIDFDNPHVAQNELSELTLAIEQECPVGKAFGVSNIGEGIVWRHDGIQRYVFKTKGDKHSNSRVKTIAAVDVERIESLKDLCAELTPNGRLEQGIQLVFDTLNGGNIDIKRTGEYIKWVMGDILKEELATITENGFTVKEISSYVAKNARDFLMNYTE